MSIRALLAVGCNRYDHLGDLEGAEADAIAIFDALIIPEIGDYDVDRSRLLKSPKLQDVRNALTELLFGQDPLDVLTVVFAGHGQVGGGSFYMTTRDTRPDALSATALSLADLLRMIAEAAPKQTYIFIDACQAGGLISDLNVILKSEVMGKFGTPGVTLLATAASDEPAVEEGGNGIGTRALLDCIHGRTFLQDSNPALDLVEIGRAVSERVAAAGEQTPVVWGLNLYGPSSFCRNPHAATGNAPLRSVLVGWPEAEVAEALRAGVLKLWEPYVAIPSRWDPRDLVDRLAPLLAQVRDNPASQINLLHRIIEACASQARESKDVFREIEIRAACAVSLLPFSDDGEVRSFLSANCEQISTLVEEALDGISRAVCDYEFALITGGLSDLYQLPIRLTKILGWASYTTHFREASGRHLAPATARMSEIFGWLFRTYSLSIVAMSDVQAPYILSAAVAAAKLGLVEEGADFLGHLFTSAVRCGGQIARDDLDAANILSYLVKRNLGTKQSSKHLAQPTELVSVLLRASHLFDLSDQFNPWLSSLDHLQINAFLPADYRSFGDQQITSGKNAMFQIGQDIWSVADLERAWPPFDRPLDPAVKMTSLLACLIFPDRTPWFLLADHALAIEPESNDQLVSYARDLRVTTAG